MRVFGEAGVMHTGHFLLRERASAIHLHRALSYMVNFKQKKTYGSQKT